MSDIEQALAEALHLTGHSKARMAHPDWSDEPCGWCRDDAAAILATPQMQAIARRLEEADAHADRDEWHRKAVDRDVDLDRLARQAAIGAAVERASDEYLVVRRLPSLGPDYPAAWQVWREDADGVDYPTHTRSTLGDAIAAALGEDDR